VAIIVMQNSRTDEAHLPTPCLTERINIGVFLLWIVALAAALLRTPVTTPGRSDAR
jgi:hypothetical protein